MCSLVVKDPPGQQQTPNPPGTSLSDPGNLVLLPSGKADCKKCLWQCEFGRLEKANVVL